jgi:hypothetical protein
VVAEGDVVEIAGHNAFGDQLDARPPMLAQLGS